MTRPPLRWPAAVVLAGLIALLITACGSASKGAQPADGNGGQSQLVKVRFASITSAGQSDIPTILQQQGIAKRYGLDVEITDISQTGQQWTALRGGSADVASGSVLDLLRQRKAGLNARALTSFQTFSNPIVVPADSPIHSVAQLRGKKLATPGANIFDFQIARAAAKRAYGIDLANDTKLTEAAPVLINKLLDKGEVDAGLQFSSLALAPVVEKKYRVLTDLPSLLKAGGLSENSFYLLYSVDDDWVKAHPNKVQDLDRAIHAAVAVLARKRGLWPPLAAKVGVTSPSLLGPYITQTRATERTRYGPGQLQPTQRLFDAVAQTVGAESLGVTKVDPAAFIFHGR